MYQEKASQECYKFKLFYSKESEGLVQELKFTLHWLKKHFYEWLRISAKVAENSTRIQEMSIPTKAEVSQRWLGSPKILTFTYIYSTEPPSHKRQRWSHWRNWTGEDKSRGHPAWEQRALSKEQNPKPGDKMKIAYWLWERLDCSLVRP